MTKKEKDKLATLVGGMIELAEVLHPPTADALVEKLSGADDSEVLDILIWHLHNSKIYEIYRRFDHEASVRDIEKLLNIIHHNGK
jgi:hypothetical protein